MTFKDILAERGAHRYELHYSDGIRGALKGNDPKKLIAQIQQRKGVREWSLFKNADGFHGTHQDEYLVAWWSSNGQSAWDTDAKTNPEIAKKKYKERVGGRIGESVDIKNIDAIKNEFSENMKRLNAVHHNKGLWNEGI